MSKAKTNPIATSGYSELLACLVDALMETWLWKSVLKGKSFILSWFTQDIQMQFSKREADR